MSDSRSDSEIALRLAKDFRLSQAATLKHDVAKLTCTQSKMTIALDAMGQRSKNAIKHIKPG